MWVIDLAYHVYQVVTNETVQTVAIVVAAIAGGIVLVSF